ncbi:MAG: sensor histidine kinase, partial [Terriglobales bacterium]
GIECRVKDRGPGLSEQTRLQLFRKYMPGEAVDWIGHSGLGLFIAGWMVQSHGGEIGLKPAGEEKGSVFWFTIPNCR